jgi:threonine dehydratase
VNIEAITAARERIADQVLMTPLTRSETLSRWTGLDVHLKFENLQFTASFKERGALNRLLLLSAEERSRGVIAMSAGNHAQALAYHGSRLGIPTCIVMPRATPNTKVEQTRVFGAEVILYGTTFDETLAHTTQLAGERSMTLVHPFDDPQVIAGQGTIGLEVLEQLPDVGTVVVPVGGGGLISGIAAAIKSQRPQVQVVGVQVERYAAVAAAVAGSEHVAGGLLTVAEGIAVKAPGANTLPLIRRYVDAMLTVNEQQVEQAVFTLLEVEKTLVEGAGAVGLAALRAYPEAFSDKPVLLILSGGNIDMMILSSVLQRGLVRSSRLVRLTVEIPDLPGALSELTQRVGELDSNIMDIVHQRTFGGSSVRSTMVELSLQMRGEEQIEQVVAGLRQAGYEIQSVS